MIAKEVDDMQNPRDVDLVVVQALEDWSSHRGLVRQFLSNIELPNVLSRKVRVQGERRNKDLGDLH